MPGIGTLPYGKGAAGAIEATPVAFVDSLGNVISPAGTSVLPLGTDRSGTIPSPSVTGSISGTTLTVTAAATPGLGIGSLLAASGIVANTYIDGFGTGTGGVGTYTVSQSQTLASTAITTSGGVALVSAANTARQSLSLQNRSTGEQIVSENGVRPRPGVPGGYAVPAGQPIAAGTSRDIFIYGAPGSIWTATETP